MADIIEEFDGIFCFSESVTPIHETRLTHVSLTHLFSLGLSLTKMLHGDLSPANLNTETTGPILCLHIILPGLQLVLSIITFIEAPLEFLMHES